MLKPKPAFLKVLLQILDTLDGAAHFNVAVTIELDK